MSAQLLRKIVHTQSNICVSLTIGSRMKLNLKLFERVPADKRHKRYYSKNENKSRGGCHVC